MLESRAFEPEFLKKLDGLVLGTKLARTMRAGRRSLGRIHGFGIEPENFREYSEGDDLRFLDWNALARLDELSIRTFRVERQIEVTVMVDASASMATPARDDKIGLALALAAGLGYVAMSENEPVRLGVFSGRRGTLRFDLTPFRRRRETYLDFRPFVNAVRCGGDTQLVAAASMLMNERRPAGIVIVVSDFLMPQGDYENALLRLTAGHHEVKVLHVFGDQESTGTYPPGAYRVRDCESGEIREVTFGPAETEAIRRRVADHAETLRSFCAQHGILYSQAFGASHLNEIVEREFPRIGEFV